MVHNTCKDCLHYKVCNFHIDEETNMTVNECSKDGGFMHKDQYVKLPAYIGQIVWLPFQSWDGSTKVLEGKVSMLQQKADKSWKIRISGGDYREEDLGLRVFFTKEEAEERAERLERYFVDG